MRPPIRLFQIIQALRRSRKPVTAEALAAELEVSTRSVYRDIANLIRQGVPIRGEVGVGYVLDRHFDMPPLMLTPAELEAAVLGAQWVAEKGDAAIASSARDLISKIGSAVPQHLRTFIVQPTVGVPANNVPIVDGLNMAKTRDWIRAGFKLRIHYSDREGLPSERIIWPVMVGYAESVRLLAAWCELRQAFRHFRTDRISGAEFLNSSCGLKPGELKRRWESYMRSTRELRMASKVTSSR
jgi:predicted DNA-binding transcriptional regulator YafY